VPAATRSWTAERPSFGLALAVLGALIAAMGLFVLEWDADTDWFALRHTLDAGGDQYSVVSQVYSRVLFLPVLLAVLVTGLCATAGRTIARVGSATAGIVFGGWLIGVLIWVETGSVGTDDSRQHALSVLVVVALVGVGCMVLGAGALFDDTAVLARSLAAVVAVLAVILHVYVIEDVLSDPAVGAWATAVGYALLAIAPALPYRRIERTGQ
jgi:hypothetical protein